MRKPFDIVDICCMLQSQEPACEHSCEYLEDIHSTHPGVCPPPSEVTGFDAACVEGCSLDSECEDTSVKCCFNGCGHTCMESRHQNRGILLNLQCGYLFVQVHLYKFEVLYYLDVICVDMAKSICIVIWLLCLGLSVI